MRKIITVILWALILVITLVAAISLALTLWLNFSYTVALMIAGVIFLFGILQWIAGALKRSDKQKHSSHGSSEPR